METKKFAEANLDDKSGTNSGFIHRVVASLLCCGKVYKVEDFEVYYWDLKFPMCDCGYNNMNLFIEGIITDGNGFADLAYDKYHYNSFCDRTADPKHIHWNSVLSCNRNYKMSSNLNYKYGCKNRVVLNEPTFIIQDLVKNFNSATITWNDNFYHNKYFDTCATLQVCRYTIQKSDWTRLVKGKRTRLVSDTEQQPPSKILRSSTLLTQLETYEDFLKLCKNRKMNDANLWKHFGNNLVLFNKIKDKEPEKLKIIGEIERINNRSTVAVKKTFTNNSKPKTYYGHRLLSFLCDLQDNPDVEYMEKNIYEAVAAKYRQDNSEVEMWLQYKGDVENIKTPGLRETIRQTEFDVCYKMFIEKITRKLPMLIDRSYVVYSCTLPIKECRNNNLLNPIETKSERCFDLYQHVVPNHKQNLWPAILLTDAIKWYAAAHDNTFPFVEFYGKKKVIHVIKDLEKYDELWRFIDMLNIFEMNMSYCDKDQYGILNNPINEYGSIKNVPILVNNKDCSYYYWVSPRVTYKKTLMNRYYSMFNIIVDKLIHFKIEKSKCVLEQQAMFRSLFVDDFNDYLDSFQANHSHVCLRNSLYTTDTTTFKYKNVNGEIVLWPGNEDVLKSERKRYANKIADWWIDQMYHPNSNHVLKIKQHFENIVADRNNAVNN